MTMNREIIIEKLNDLKERGFEVPSEDMIKTNEEIEKIKESAKINTELLDFISENIKPGMTTEELDKIAHDFIISKGAVPALLGEPSPLGSHDYPKSTSISINNEICLGIPNTDTVLKDGDIVSVCIPIVYNGYCSDLSRMFMIGNVNDEAKRLVEVAKECLYKEIQAIKPWGHIGDIVDAVEKHAHANGYSVFDKIGHGIGVTVFEDPTFGPKGVGLDALLGEPTFGEDKIGQGMVLAPGMVLSLEPPINEGSKDWYLDKNNGWTIYTNDGKLSAQWGYTVLVTESGAEIICK